MKIDRESTISCILALASSVVLGIASIRGKTSFEDYFELKRSADVLSLALINLEKEITNLELEITRIEESSSYAQKVLRDKYHITDEGESIIFFAD